MSKLFLHWSGLCSVHNTGWGNICICTQILNLYTLFFKEILRHFPQLEILSVSSYYSQFLHPVGLYNFLVDESKKSFKQTYKIIIGANLWDIIVFRLVAYLLNMICLILFYTNLVYGFWYKFDTVFFINFSRHEHQIELNQLLSKHIPSFMFPLQSL